MSRYKSNSVASAPSRTHSSYLSNYDASCPVWTYRRMDSSPPPPYTSREASQSGSILPSATTDTSLRSQREPPASSEYTPLLDDFTRKFVESQLSVPTSQQVHGSTSQLVPPELLVLCQQQAPFNPNFDSLSTSSTNSLLTASDSHSRHNSVSLPSTRTCGIFSRNRCLHLRWFIGNFILLTTLMSFNWGMLISPQVYSNFFLVIMQRSNASSTDHQANSIVVDLLVSSLVQIVLMLIVTVSGLILLYAASKVVVTVRKRFQLSVKYRIHMSNQTPFPWFFITYERIVYETLGAFFARLLSFILTLYLFGVSSLYVLVLSDYLDMFLSLLGYGHISELFCQQHPWFLSHDVVVSVWLSLVLLLAFGLNSFRRRNKYSSSLWYLKKIATVVGFFAVIYLIFMIVFVYLSSKQSSQANLLKAKRIYSSNYRKLVCLKSNASFDWGCLNKNWILLISSVPLLIAPFHLNELLITLLYASQQKQPPTSKTPHTSHSLLNASQPSSAASGSRLFSSNRIADNLPNGAPVPDLQQRLQLEQEATQWEQTETRTILDDTISADVTSPPPTDRHIFDSFSKPLLSFGSVRNLYVLVAFAVCLLNIVVNVFVYISAFNATNGTDGFHSSRVRSFSQFRSRFSQSEDILLLDFNFLRNYLHLLEPDSSGQSKQSWHRCLLMGASVFLLLKTTLTYLLIAFRGLLAHQTLTSSTKRDNLIIANQAGICLNSFLFTSPFVLWNFLVLLFALLVGHSTSLLQYVLLVVCGLGCLLVFVYPALILLYFSFQSMSKNSLPFTSSYALLSVSFKALRWPKSCLVLGLFLLSLGLSVLVFWLYAYLQTRNHALTSILPLITHSNSTSLYCPTSS